LGSFVSGLGHNASHDFLDGEADMSDTVVSAQSFPGLMLLGISLLASLSLFYRDRAEGEDPLHLTLTVVGVVMIITGFVEACLVFLNLLFIPFALVFTGVLIYVGYRYILRRGTALLAVMAAAARRWMPLGPAVEAFSHEWRGRFGRRCRRLAAYLNAGMPLAEAIRQVEQQSRLREFLDTLSIFRFVPPFVFLLPLTPMIPRRAAALIEAGQRGGNLTAALAEAIRQPPAHLVLLRVWSAFWYLGAVLLVGTASLTFVMVKIVPAFIKIFSDFDAELPPLTVALIQSCDWFAYYGWPPLLLALLGLACFIALWSLDIVGWLPPPLNTLSRRKEAAIVLRSLAVATETNRPLEPALAALAEYYPSMVVRTRLRLALAQVARGGSWPESLRDQGLLRRGELALIASAQRVGNLPWALREVAESIERRLALHLHRWLEITVPILVLLIGAMVMLIVIGLFLPLISLIERLV
jgi:type II secretory pathway component PulF